MKSFLDQNKDLLENLGPQVSQLNEIQEKVNQHDQDINTLYNRVDQLANDASGGWQVKLDRIKKVETH